MKSLDEKLMVIFGKFPTAVDNWEMVAYKIHKPTITLILKIIRFVVVFNPGHCKEQEYS